MNGDWSASVASASNGAGDSRRQVISLHYSFTPSRPDDEAGSLAGMTGPRHVPIAWSEDELTNIVDAYKDERGALLPLLHAVQERFGYIDAGAVAPIAAGLNLSRAEVHGVITFYADFRTEPAGRSRLRVCRAEACQSMGAERVIAHACARLGLDLGETATDGSITLESVMCLGNCALSPAVMIDGRLVGRVDEDRIDEIVAAARSLPDEPAPAGQSGLRR
jgi:formate dehydrogenase subunit gamma